MRYIDSRLVVHLWTRTNYYSCRCRESKPIQGFFYSKVVYIFMDIKHRVCQHKDRAHKMQRLYKRENGKFIGCAWMCPDCGQMIRDIV